MIIKPIRSIFCAFNYFKKENCYEKIDYTVAGGMGMNRLFESADRYLERSDWKDIVLIKF